MATKQQEREALQKIRDIVDSLGGTESYIGKAFEGCFEIAEDNIENDFFCSMKQRADRSDREVESYKKTAEAVQKIEKENAATIEVLKAAQKQTAEELKTVTEEKEAALKKYADKLSEISFMQAENEALKLEIIKLKARLYDFMMQ